MKIFIKLLGIFGLIALFVIAYMAVSQMDDNENDTDNNVEAQSTADFSSDKQTTGEGGGLHYMRNLVLEDHEAFYRVKVETSLNRSSVLDTIETPLTTAELKNDTTCYLALHLSDTTQILEDENIFLGARGKTEYTDRDPITSIDVKDTVEEGQEVFVGLHSCEARFKLGSDPQSPGHIWLDVLK